MIHAVVPVKNEMDQISKTLDMISSTLFDKIIVVLNGCDDNSLGIVHECRNDRIEYIYFNKALGIDIPRVVGAHLALREDTKGVVFVDGDMNSGISNNLNDIIESLKKNNVDIALTNCYPEVDTVSPLARLQLHFRKLLNVEIGLYDKIGYSIPSHGPHGVSRRFLDAINIEELAIPPVSLALGVANSFNIEAVTTISASNLPSTIRDNIHANLIAKTIIGDCLEAMEYYHSRDRTRKYEGISYIGYHKNRRFDILSDYFKIMS